MEEETNYEFLRRIGLTESEIKVYLALLKLGASSKGKLVKEAKIAAVTKGGMVPKKILLNNNEEIILESAADAKRFLSKVISGVWQGSIPATPVANTLGFLVRCFLMRMRKQMLKIGWMRLRKF